jgi:hypothetical protein
VSEFVKGCIADAVWRRSVHRPRHGRPRGSAPHGQSERALTRGARSPPQREGRRGDFGTCRPLCRVAVSVSQRVVRALLEAARVHLSLGADRFLRIGDVNVPAAAICGRLQVKTGGAAVRVVPAAPNNLFTGSHGHPELPRDRGRVVFAVVSHDYDLAREPRLPPTRTPTSPRS